jgi:hypothetical protein
MWVVEWKSFLMGGWFIGFEDKQTSFRLYVDRKNNGRRADMLLVTMGSYSDAYYSIKFLENVSICID